MQFSFVVAASLVISLTGCFPGGNGGQQEGSIVTGTRLDTRTAVQEPDEKVVLPKPSEAVEQAPEEFVVKFETTKGDFMMNIHREWSPNGADRFFNMVRIGYFKDICIFRAVDGFMFQFGVHGDPDVSAVWGDATIKDDEISGHSNLPGTITFAKSEFPDSRSIQLFINLVDNSRLDPDGFTPFGEVAEGGMDVVKEINTEYGDTANLQGPLAQRGNVWIRERFPNFDYIKSITLVGDEWAEKDSIGGEKKADDSKGDGEKTGDGDKKEESAGDGEAKKDGSGS